MGDFNDLHKNMVCAVITTYRPDHSFVQRVNRVLEQVGYVVIVNDSGTNGEQARLNKAIAEKASNPEKIQLIHNEMNYGQAKSLNIGLKKAECLGSKYILTLDDDTTVFNWLVERLLIYYRAIHVSTSHPVGVIALSWIPIGDPQPSRQNFLSDWHEKRGVITSGSFFSLRNYGKIGPFRDDFFIDFVDYDFCLKSRKKGFKVYKINEPGFWHSIGMNLGRQQIKNNEYSSMRLYYCIRNGWITLRDQLLIDPLFSIAILRSQMILLFRILLTSSEKRRHVKHFFAGFVDAMKGKMGKYILHQ